MTTTMMMMKRYPVYKDSGTEWLGEIPKHWRIKRLKHICTRSALYGANESAGQYADEGVRFLRTSDINDSGTLINDAPVFISPSVVKDYILQDGDILFSRSGTIGRSFLYKNDLHGECAYAGYLVRFCLNSNRVNPKFVFQFTKSRQFNDWLMSIMIESTIGNVNGQKYAGMPLAIPDIAEQQAIADYLDRQTVKIDVLIAKKERQIELLKEKRLAIISHAVTKGLNPGAPMEDSGIAWLGEIPTHWEMKRLKYCIKNGLINGLFKKQASYGYGVKIINVIDLYSNNFIIDFKNLERVDVDQREIENYKVKNADIFFVRSSLKLEGVGASACMGIVEEPTVFESHLVKISPNCDCVIPRYIIYYLNSQLTRQRLIALAETTTMTTVAQPKIASLEICAPSLDEQMAIAEYLDNETSKIDGLIAKIARSIEKLKEYRTTLISAAVTGKIDLRGEA